MLRTVQLGLCLALLTALATTLSCGDIERLPRQPNERPTAVLAAPAFADIGETVVLDGSGSSDVDGVIVEYRFAPGDSEEILITAEPNIGHAYRTSGDYTATLTVVDDRGGKASAVTPISVR